MRERTESDTQKVIEFLIQLAKYFPPTVEHLVRTVIEKAWDFEYKPQSTHDQHTVNTQSTHNLHTVNTGKY